MQVYFLTVEGIADSYEGKFRLTPRVLLRNLASTIIRKNRFVPVNREENHSIDLNERQKGSSLVVGALPKKEPIVLLVTPEV